MSARSNYSDLSYLQTEIPKSYNKTVNSNDVRYMDDYELQLKV
jgi:hypothetical protein